MFLPERIYVANIHEDISESDIAGVFEAFGKITQCSLIPDPTTRKHKTYGYIQFEKTEAADAAVTGMNGFDLGGRRLVVLKSIMGGPMPGGMDTMPELPSLINTALAGRVQLTIPAQPPVAPIPSAVSVALEQATATAAKIHVPQPTFLFQPQVPAPPVTSAKAVVAQPPPAPLPTLAPSSASAADLTAEENVSTISGKQRYEMMQKLAAARPNPRTIVLRDMVNPNEIDSELENEIKAECSKFGKVNKVVIHVGPEVLLSEMPTNLFITYNIYLLVRTAQILSRFLSSSTCPRKQPRPTKFSTAVGLAASKSGHSSTTMHAFPQPIILAKKIFFFSFVLFLSLECIYVFYPFKFLLLAY